MKPHIRAAIFLFLVLILAGVVIFALVKRAVAPVPNAEDVTLFY